MTHNAPTDGNGSQLMVPLQFSDFAVSWAGPGGRDDFCFGSEDGKLQFTTVDGAFIGGFVSGEENPEAVNGVAFIGPVIAVSTRHEVTFWSFPRRGSRQVQRAIFFHCGSHSIIATSEGYFVAALGRTGLMKARAGRADEQPVTVSRATHRVLDFYKVISLHSYGQPEVLACAARFGGVAATELVQEECAQADKVNHLPWP